MRLSYLPRVTQHMCWDQNPNPSKAGAVPVTLPKRGLMRSWCPLIRLLPPTRWWREGETPVQAEGVGAAEWRRASAPDSVKGVGGKGGC